MDLAPRDVLRIARTLRENDLLHQSVLMFEILLNEEPYASSPVADDQARREYALRLQDAGDYELAASVLIELVDNLDTNRIDYWLQRLQLMSDLGCVYFDAGDWSRTVETLEPTLEQLRNALGVHRAASANLHINLAEAYLQIGEPDSGLRSLSQADTDRSWLVEDPSLLGHLIYKRARILDQMGGDALGAIETAWDELERAGRGEGFEVCWAFRVDLLCRADKFDEASTVLQLGYPDEWRRNPTLFWLRVGYLEALTLAGLESSQKSESIAIEVLARASALRHERPKGFFRLEMQLCWLLGQLFSPGALDRYKSVVKEYSATYAPSIAAIEFEDAERALRLWPAS